MGRSFLREESTMSGKRLVAGTEHLVGSSERPGPGLESISLCCPGASSFRWEPPDPRKGKGLVAATLPPSLSRALCPAKARGRGWNPRRSNCDSALSARRWNRGCWPGTGASQRYPPSRTVVALMIQLPSACLEGPALAWEREEVLGLGGALRGPWSNSSGC